MSAVKKLSWGYLNYEKLAPTNATNAKKNIPSFAEFQLNPGITYIYIIQRM